MGFDVIFHTLRNKIPYAPSTAQSIPNFSGGDTNGWYCDF